VTGNAKIFPIYGQFSHHILVNKMVQEKQKTGKFAVAYPGFFFVGIKQIQLRTEGRERGSGSGSPLVRGSAQFANE
jgi:hypothetical protein